MTIAPKHAMRHQIISAFGGGRGKMGMRQEKAVAQINERGRESARASGPRKNSERVREREKEKKLSE